MVRGCVVWGFCRSQLGSVALASATMMWAASNAIQRQVILAGLNPVRKKRNGFVVWRELDCWVGVGRGLDADVRVFIVV